jgi:hypothetical protein
MTIAQVYGPWSGTAITWAEALQPWAVSFVGTASRLLEVQQEIRITNIDYDARIIDVEPEG